MPSVHPDSYPPLLGLVSHRTAFAGSRTQKFFLSDDHFPTRQLSDRHGPCCQLMAADPKHFVALLYQQHAPAPRLCGKPTRYMVGTVSITALLILALDSGSSLTISHNKLIINDRASSQPPPTFIPLAEIPRLKSSVLRRPRVMLVETSGPRNALGAMLEPSKSEGLFGNFDSNCPSVWTVCLIRVSSMVLMKSTSRGVACLGRCHRNVMFDRGSIQGKHPWTPFTTGKSTLVTFK